MIVTALTSAINSVVGQAALVQKVYFPREVLPISAVLSNTVNFLLSLTVLFAMIFLYQVQLTNTLLFLPLVLLVQVMFTAAIIRSRRSTSA